MDLGLEGQTSKFAIQSEWNEESILKAYGYSVFQQDGLTDGERQELLGEIVDLEIVAALLNFFIRTHSHEECAEARRKWEKEKEDIQNYRVNPGRFIIASKLV